MNYNYTFIIPHKNIPKLLVRCINSIPKRNDSEIIIIDDNSDPCLVDFDNFPFLGKENIKIIFDKSAKGAGHARNLGIKEAAGKWIVFIDADDFYNYCISDVMDEYINDNADIIFFNANSVDNYTYLPSERAKRINTCIEKGVLKETDGEYYLRYVQGCPVCKFIKKKLLLENDITFEEIPKHNDVRFSYTTGYYAKDIKADTRAIYCITSRSDSLSTNQSLSAKLLRIKVTCDWIKFRKEHNIYCNDKDELLYNSLAYLYFEDKAAFLEGVDMIKKIGISKFTIIKNISMKIIKHKIINIIPDALIVYMRKFY